MELLHTDNNGVITTHESPLESAGHDYSIRHPAVDTFKTKLSFQNGPAKQKGVNGVTSEALLAVLIHRTRTLNKNYPCRENAVAIIKMQEALMWFEERTKDRQARGVEGENKA